MRFLDRRDDTVGAGNHRNSCGDHRLLRGSLVAHRVHYLRGGADERNAAGTAKTREICVLGEESEAGVYRLGMGYLTRRDYRLGIEVAVLGSRRANAHSFVRDLGMQSRAVSLGIDCHCLYSHLTAGAHDTDSDLAAVRNKYLIKHSVSSRLF